VEETHDELLEHYRRCSSDGTNVVNKRRVENQLIHEPFFHDKFGNEQRRSLSFKRTDVFKILRPPVLASLDFECSNVASFQSAETDLSRPTNAVFDQKILGFAYQNFSTYER
jgi:hypothetical protein